MLYLAGIVFLADALFYLVFVAVGYLGLSVILYAGIFLLWRIAVSPAVPASKHLTGRSKHGPHIIIRRCDAGLTAVGFPPELYSLLILPLFLIAASTLAVVWAIITAGAFLRMLLAVEAISNTSGRRASRRHCHPK